MYTSSLEWPHNQNLATFRKPLCRFASTTNRAFEEQWGESTDNEALFAPNPIQMAKMLAKYRTMRFRFTPFNSSPAIITFDVRGFDRHIGLVSKTCSWERDRVAP